MGIFDSKKQRRPRPDFSNVRSGGSSTAEAPRPAEAPDDEAPTPGSSDRHYVVAEGDSLWKIAQRHYGDGERWRRIYEANRDLIKDPDRIYPGQQLRIPE
jgi:nucleoid-associated protein YgaU